MCMTDRMALCLQFGTSAFDGTIGGSPTQHQYLSFVSTTVQFLFGNEFCDLVHFFLPDLHHQLVVLGFITDIACYILLFPTTDPVFQPGRTGYGPGPG